LDGDTTAATTVATTAEIAEKTAGTAGRKEHRRSNVG
jgi:hypothetical protein